LASTQHWHLIETWDAEPGLNMGLDEALLDLGPETPVLRLYTWKPEALSLGYFQRYEDVGAVAEAEAVVRRLTGGGAIHHARELTFSITAPLSHPLYRGPVASSYERVHGALAKALAELGITAELRGERPLLSDREGTGMCFHRSTPLDLVWSARKGVGSAQRRRGGRVLHHGSIKLEGSPLEGEIAGLEEVAPELGAEKLAPIVLAALSTHLGLEFERGGVEGKLSERALERAPYFSSEAFLRRR